MFLPKINEFGLFLFELPNINNGAFSFFENCSKGAEFSNGKKSFFFPSITASGFLNECWKIIFRIQ